MLLGRWGFGAPKWSIPERKHMPKRPRSDGAMSVGRSLSPQLVCNGGHQRADARQKHKSETREDEQYRQRPSPTENFSCVVCAPGKNDPACERNYADGNQTNHGSKAFKEEVVDIKPLANESAEQSKGDEAVCKICKTKEYR